MEGKKAKWSVAQFAQLHKINKRMLHYYGSGGEQQGRWNYIGKNTVALPDISFAAFLH